MKVWFFTLIITISSIFSLFSQSISKTTFDTLITKEGFTVTKQVCFTEEEVYCQKEIDIYFPSWKPKQVTYYDLLGRPTGQFTSYYINGNVEEAYLYEKGRKAGLYISYFETGSIKTIGRYKDVNCDSDIKYSFDTVEVQGEMEDEIYTLVVRKIEDEKIGKWFDYNYDGTLKGIKEYD